MILSDRNHSLEHFYQIWRKTHILVDLHPMVPSFSTCFDNFTHFLRISKVRASPNMQLITPNDSHEWKP